MTADAVPQRPQSRLGVSVAAEQPEGHGAVNLGPELDFFVEAGGKACSFLGERLHGGDVCVAERTIGGRAQGAQQRTADRLTQGGLADPHRLHVGSETQSGFGLVGVLRPVERRSQVAEFPKQRFERRLAGRGLTFIQRPRQVAEEPQVPLSPSVLFAGGRQQFFSELADGFEQPVSGSLAGVVGNSE